MTYEFHPDALFELEQTASYYDAREAGLGIRFIDSVEETVGRILDAPTRWRIIAIASKDSDFQQRSLLVGQPPKFIWLRVGNCPVRHVHDVLRRYAAAIEAFEQSMSESHLMLP